VFDDAENSWKSGVSCFYHSINSIF